jgi:hypothetical protein
MTDEDGLEFPKPFGESASETRQCRVSTLRFLCHPRFFEIAKVIVPRLRRSQSYEHLTHGVAVG